MSTGDGPGGYAQNPYRHDNRIAVVVELTAAFDLTHLFAARNINLEKCFYRKLLFF